MTTTKYRFEIFSVYDGTGVAQHLEKMAAKGWMLESIGRSFWRYERIEPKNLRFSTTFLEKASSFDPEYSEERETFHAFCERTGWRYVAGWERMQIFCNEQDDPIPLDTDPTTQLRVIHRAMRASLITFTILAAISLFFAYGFIGQLITDPIGILSDSLGTFTGVCFTVLLLLCCAELFTYYRWRRRAKRAAEQGGFFPTKGINLLSAICLGIVALDVVFYLLSARTGHMGVWMILYPLIIFFAVSLSELVKKRLKKHGATPNSNRAATVFSAGITAALLSAVLIPIVFITTPSNPDPSMDLINNPPVDFASLTGQSENYIRTIDYNHSVFLTEYSMTLSPGWDATEEFELEFTVTKPNLPTLNNWCKAQILDRYAPWRLRDTSGRYSLIDSQQDGAPELFQLCDDTGLPHNHYLFCYGNHYVEVIPHWEITNEQLTSIGNMLHTA